MDNILLTIKNETFQASLYSNETTKAIKELLPLNLTMTELHGNEKYYTFTESFPTQSEKVGTIKAGDLMLFGNDTLVLFYENFSTPYSYTRIGKIDNVDNLSNILGISDAKVKIELAD